MSSLVQYLTAYNPKGSPKENFNDPFETDITDENCIYIRYDNSTMCYMERIRIYTDTDNKKIVEKTKSYGAWSLRADPETEWKPINAMLEFERVSI